MFECGQRSFFHGAALAAFVVFGLAACSDSAAEPQAEAASTTTIEQASSPTTTPPTSTSPPERTTPLPDTNQSSAALPELDPGGLNDVAGLIAYRTRGGDIVTSSPTGTDQTTWSRGTEFFNMQPTWAPSGRVLAWSQTNSAGANIVHANIDDPQASLRQTPASPAPFYLAWSPGQTRILGLRNGLQGLEVLMVDTSDDSLDIAFLGQPFFTDWVADDVVTAAIGGLRLAELDAASLTPSLRDTGEPLGLFQSPIAIDGSVLLATTNGDTNTIVELAPDGSVTPLARAQAAVRMSLSPNGESLAVVVDAGEDDLELISYSMQTEDEDVIDLRSGRVSIIERSSGDVVTRPEVGVLAASWSPTGDHLALLERRNNLLRWVYADPFGLDPATPGAAFAPSEEFATAYLPFIDQYERSTTRWSPDGKAFVFAGQIDDQAGIWIDRIDDAAGPAFIAEGDIAFWSAE